MKRAVVLGVALGFILTGTLGAQEEEEKKDMWAPRPAWGGGPAADSSAGTASKELEADPDQVMWVRGQVVSVSGGTIVIEYFDYKAGDVRMKIMVDSKTVLNGISALVSLKHGMSVSIDYQVNRSGRAVAKVVTLNTDADSDWFTGK